MGAENKPKKIKSDELLAIPLGRSPREETNESTQDFESSTSSTKLSSFCPNDVHSDMLVISFVYALPAVQDDGQR